MLEKIAYYSILKHVEGSLTNHQFGFLPNRPTLQQLLTFTNEIFKTKTEMDVLRISRKRSIWCLTTAFLRNKTLLVSVVSYGHGWGSTCSNFFRVSESVILCQPFSIKMLSGGSVLGPLLFINDLPECIEINNRYWQTLRRYQ